jgi:catechol 2,3-dioxygenase-like lactoylglutathione lyase family enzyme
MLERVIYPSVPVNDQDRTLDFYTNVLGFEQRADNPTPDGPRFLTVGLEGQDFQLVLWPGTSGQAQPVQGRIPAACTIETGGYPGGVRGTEVAWREVRDGRARVPVGLCRAVRGS